MAHAVTETVARPAAQLAGSLRLRADQQTYVDQHSSHQQSSGKPKTAQQIKEQQRAEEIAQAVNPRESGDLAAGTNSRTPGAHS